MENKLLAILSPSAIKVDANKKEFKVSFARFSKDNETVKESDASLCEIVDFKILPQHLIFFVAQLIDAGVKYEKEYKCSLGFSSEEDDCKGGDAE